VTTAALYHWRIKPGREDDFAEAWDEGTRRIHEACGSYGAILHRAADGLFWSYASWPDEATRQACFAQNDWFSMDCFRTMQDCVAERFDEVVLDVVRDRLDPDRARRDIPVLTTERLLLRPMAMSDAEALAPALMDAANLTYWSSGPLDSVDAVRSYIRWNVHAPNAVCTAICERDAPETALGWVILIDSRPGVAELGYILRPDAQGRGLAREAAEELIRFGFDTLGLRRIFADVDPDNSGSIALLTALGFAYEGRLKSAWETHIGVRDSLIYARLPA